MLAGPDLVEVGDGSALALALVVGHIDELEVVGKARIGTQEVGGGRHVGQVAQVLVAPVVQLRQTWPRTPLLA